MSKTIFFWFFILLIICRTDGQTLAGEDSLSLNGEWFFKTDPYLTGEKNSWYKPGLDDGAWEAMAVPSNWDTKNEYAHYTGQAWYRKKILVPAEWKGKVIRLLFEAVYHDSKVWLNNKLLGTNNSGFLPFEFDVSQLINYGGENIFVVCADNTFRRGAIWNWGGIRRPVVLVANNSVRISSQFISPSVDLLKSTAEVAVRASIQNNESKSAEVLGEILLSATNGFKRSLPFTVTIPPNSSKDISVNTTLKKNEVHLWNFDDPFLYNSQVILRKGTQLMHIVNDRFGLRKIEVDNKNYAFRLNGESIRVMGFNLVPDDRTNGNTLPLWRIKEDIDMIKSFGANMARLTHLPMHKEMLDYLDEKGIMVYSEIPLWGFDQLADKNNPVPKEWLKRLITNNYNHPCIIGWGVGNEIGDYPHVMEYVDDAIKYVRTLDSTRMAMMVSHTANKGPDPIQYSDIGLINKYGKGIGMLADNIHKLHPDKVLFYSEYGYNQFSEDLDGDIDAKGMLDSLRFKPYLIGGSLWTFNDYRSNYIGTKEVSENRPWGIVNVFRQKKKAYYAFRKEYVPVSDFKIGKLERGHQGSASIVIIPRKVMDLPAYTLNDYMIIWKTVDLNENIIQGGFIKLPIIRPGDDEITRTIKWQGADEISSLHIELISPMNYSVYDTTIFFNKPPSPKILYVQGVRTEMNNVPPNSGSIRVVFEKNALATAYKAKFGRDDLTNETVSTINHFIDIPKLAFNETYQLIIVAINPEGETESEIKKVQVGVGSAPPIIYYTEPADKGFFVGYASQSDDYLYKLQYSTIQGDTNDAKTIQATTKGVLFVPGLENGKTYFYRMKRLKHNMYESSWSEERSVRPDGGLLPVSPVLKGILYQGNEAVLCFKPVKKSIGYIVQHRSKETDKWVSLHLNAAQIEHVRIRNLEKNKLSYQFRMASINQYGQSYFTGALNVIK